MATKIAEDLAEGDHILFDLGANELSQLTVSSTHVFEPGGVDQVSAFCHDQGTDEDRIIGMAYGQEFEVPGW